MLGLGNVNVQFLHAHRSDNASVAVYVQADEIVGEVCEADGEGRFLQHVAETGQHAVAPVLGVGDSAVVQDPDEASRASAEAAVALSRAVARGDERHFHALDELLHDRGELTGNLVAVELPGSLRSAVSLLENTFTRRARLAVVPVALPRRQESPGRLT